MAIVLTDELEEGMILAEDVTDISSRLIMAKGQRIESKHPRILKIWGISEVRVDDGDSPDNQDSETPDPEEIERVKEETRYHFRHVDLSHPAMEELFRLALLFRSRSGRQDQEETSIPTETEEIENHIDQQVCDKIIDQGITLPEIPAIVSELNEIIADPLSSSHNIAQVVRKSPSLAAVLLKIVNSSMYGFPGKIDSVSRAVTVIGTKEITTLALGISAIKVFESVPEEIMDMSSFLKHSFACAIISRAMGAHMNMAQTEQLFTSGLLHDIGKLIVYKYFPIESKNLFALCAKENALLHVKENELFGCKHTDIAEYLIEKWSLPLTLKNDIIYHHNPSASHSPVQPSIIHVADIIVNGLGIGSSGERSVPSLDPEAWANLNLAPSALDVIVTQADHQVSTILDFLQP